MRVKAYSMARLGISLIGFAMVSCFTGVESTPRITFSDVKKEKIVTTPEQIFLSEIGPQSPLEWAQGKKFYVTDPKISIVFSSAQISASDEFCGKDIVYHRMYPVEAITGEKITEIEFVGPNGEHLTYRDNTPYEDLGMRKQLDVPFTIEESIVEQVRSQLIGRKYYVVTPMWYAADGTKAVNGLRHIEVEIIDVKPGNTVYPIRVVFKPVTDTQCYSLYMTVGDQRTSTRNFHTLFSFEDPRVKYPQIASETWDLIIHSKVKSGMTRDECRLALGSPQSIGQRPTNAGMVEYWSYSDGVYLLFEDGLLSYFRK